MTKSNNTKSNTTTIELLTVAKMHTEIAQILVGNGKQYTDTTNYSAFGLMSKNRIEFSVNCKKTRYNIYCNKLIYDTLVNSKTKFDKTTEFCGDINNASKTIPYKIESKCTNDILNMVKILKNTFCTVTE